ncbi:MAG TPA: arylesterase [Acidisarcina sp.]|nr:arylesterase [Acidisarcina sp.]
MLSLTAAVGCRDSRPPEAQPSARADIPPVPEAAPVKLTKDTRPIIVAFGDSLTAGYGTEPGQSYPDYLQRLLDEEHYGYRVVNLGISGNTTKDGVERLKDVIALKPALVIVEFGGNDGLRGLPITSTRENLDNIVHGLKQSGMKVVLAGITLPPNYGADYIEQFNKNYILIARKYKVPMLPFLLQGVYGVPGSMQPDQTHATAKGNEQVARNVLALVSPLLKKPQSKAS